MPAQSNESLGDLALGGFPQVGAGPTNPVVAETVAVAAAPLVNQKLNVSVVELSTWRARLLDMVDAAIGESLMVGSTAGTGSTVEGSVTDRVRALEFVTYTSAYLRGVDELVVASDTLAITPAALLREAVRAFDRLAPQWTAYASVVQRLQVRDGLLTTIPAAVVEQVGVDAALTALAAIVVAERLGVLSTIAVLARLQPTVRDRVRVRAAFSSFFGADVAEEVLLGDAPTASLRALQLLMEGVLVQATQQPALLAKITVTEGVEVSAVEAIRALFNERVLEGVEVSLGYTGPQGDFTTWVLNTRTSAVSEYRDYAFNSFARVGNIYLGASRAGVHELVGDTDDGADIVAQLRGGYMQFGGTQLSRLAAAYIAMRGEGEVILRIVTSDGSEYTYHADTRNMRSTKVHMGKGQRARYFAFELITSGQDFDLDTIEFVPVVVQRRV